MRRAWQVGSRTLLAGSCTGCGNFFQGHTFRRHRRNQKDPVAYLDRRCTSCKWGFWEKR